MKKFHYILCSLLIACCPLIYAFDWGLQLNQTLNIDGVSNGSDSQDHKLGYSGTLLPWFSAPFGSSHCVGKLYLSAGITALYTEKYTDKTTFFIPELFRTELTWHVGTGNEVKLGRMLYTDPLGFIASGLFDGARFSVALGNGVFSTGLWYTGLLYKKSANITMTADDNIAYNEEFDFSRFGDTYFAPRRLIIAMDWDNPYTAPWLRLKASFIGQFDLSHSDMLYHSQYLAIRAGIPAGSFIFNLGGCVGLAELPKDIKISFAGEFGVAWMLPTSITDKLQLTCRLTTGMTEDSSFTAFVPITTVSQGDILQAKLSGLSMLRLDYTARLHETFSFNIASSYFIASDYKTYQGFPYGSPDGGDGLLLGNEFSGRLVWAPFSDLQLNLGGGIFLPSMGNSGHSTEGSQSGALWRVNLSVVLAIF